MIVLKIYQLSQFSHIHEMQDDLVLTFQNCCEFSGEDSEFYAQAIHKSGFWLGLDEIFQQACKENRVVISFRSEYHIRKDMTDSYIFIIYIS